MFTRMENDVPPDPISAKEELSEILKNHVPFTFKFSEGFDTKAPHWQDADWKILSSTCNDTTGPTMVDVPTK